MTVKVAEIVWKHLRKKAREAFPNEMLGYLFGHIEGNVIYVQTVYIAEGDDILQASPEAISVSAGSKAAAEYIADLMKMKLLGTVHTHPEAEPEEYTCEAVPSLFDYEYGWEEHVMGILHICRKGKRWQYDLRFYDPKGLYVTEFVR